MVKTPPRVTTQKMQIQTQKPGNHTIQKTIQVLKDIQEGVFARNWLLENQIGCTNFMAKRRMEADHQLEKVGKELRQLMSWTNEDKLIDNQNYNLNIII